MAFGDALAVYIDGQDCGEAVAGGRSASGLAQDTKPYWDTLNCNGTGTIPDRVVKGAALNPKKGAPKRATTQQIAFLLL